VGIPFIPTATYLLPMTLGFLVIATAILGIKAHQRRGYVPFLLGVAGSITVLIGRFGFEAQALTYTGIGLVIAASIWNSWPRRPITTDFCHACAPQAQPSNQKNL